MSEKWLDIEGYGGRYQISSHGSVRSSHRGGWRILLPWQQAGGYLMVTFSYNRARKHRSVHALVLETFVGPKPTLFHQCAHLDGDQKNNRPENLQWVTCKENHSHKVSHGTLLMGSRHYHARFNDDDVRNMRRMFKDGVSQTEIGRLYNAVPGVVNLIVHRKSWKHI